MSNQVPIYSQVGPKNPHHRSGAKVQASSGNPRVFSSLRHDPRSPALGVLDPGFDPLNHNHGGNFVTSTNQHASSQGNNPVASNAILFPAGSDAYARVEKFARESARRSARELGSCGRQDGSRRKEALHVRQAEHRINLRSLSLNEAASARAQAYCGERTPTLEQPGVPREYIPRDPPIRPQGIKDAPSSKTRDSIHHHHHRVPASTGTRDSAAGRDAIYENDGGVRGYNPLSATRDTGKDRRKTGCSAAGGERRRFLCREWAFQKLAHCLEQRPVSNTCGALILGDAGSGKTALCMQLAQPGTGPTARQQRALQRRMLARHFLQGQNENSLTMGEFIRTLVMQILSHSTQHRQSVPSQDQTKVGSTPSAPPLDQLDGVAASVPASVSPDQKQASRPRGTMDRIHERDQYDDLLAQLADDKPISTDNDTKQKHPPPRPSNTNPFLPNFERKGDEKDANKLYENHENLFLRNASQHPKDARNSRLYRQNSEPPGLAEAGKKNAAGLQKSLSTDSKNIVSQQLFKIDDVSVSNENNLENDMKEKCEIADESASSLVNTEALLNDEEKNKNAEGAASKDEVKPRPSLENCILKVSRIPVVSFKYPNMSALSSAENSPSKTRVQRGELGSASDNSDNNRDSSSSAKVNEVKKLEKEENLINLDDELPEYQNVLKPPNCPKELSPKIGRSTDYELDSFIKGEIVLNSPEFDTEKCSQKNTEKVVANEDDVPPPIPSLPINPRTLIANSYYEKLMSEPEIQQALLPHNLEKNPDDCFKKAILFPLLEIDPPKQCLFLLVDSIDETPLIGAVGGQNSTLTKDRDRSGNNSDSGTGGHGARGPGASRTIAELLANHHHLFPQWLLLVCTARKQSKYLTKMFTGFRKISLDDLRKNHVTLDVQRYILARLDGEPRLRQHVSRDAAQALDHLRIKSNGCFLYLERVLDGLATGSVALREIREIPGTLNGLYLWLCQRLFHARKFAKVQPLLNILLVAKCGVDAEMLYKCLLTTNYTITRDDFNRRLHLLRRILTVDVSTGVLSIFHHSFSEWLLDVKHCTRRFLCSVGAGHACLAMYYTLRARWLTPQEIHSLVLHMTRLEHHSSRDSKSISGIQNPNSESQLPSSSTHTSLAKAVESTPETFYKQEACTLDFHSIVLLWILDSGCRVETALLRRGEPELGKIVELGSGSDRAKSPEDMTKKVSSYSLGAVSSNTTAPPMPPFLFGLYWPVMPRDSRVLRALLEMGAQVEAPLQGAETQDGDKPGNVNDIRASQISLEQLLMLDAEEEEEVEAALSREEAQDLLVVDPTTGRAPIHMLAQSGDVQALAQALQSYELSGGCMSLIEVVDRGGQTALQLAARGGRRAVVALLLAHGAKADKADSEGWTPLRAAAWGGHTEVVELLLKHGCEVDCVDSDHRTALRAAAWSGHEEIVRLLLAHGADVNRTDLEGRTALIAAAYMGHTDIVDHLLDHGADIDHADSDGRTALAVAALCSAGGGASSGGCAQLLLERGAAAARPDKDGMTPLLVAAFEGHKEVMELLLEAEADPEAADKAGRTPLWAAAAAGHAAAVHVLLFWGCQVDTIDQDGRTVLSVAAAQGSVEVVRQLVDRGLDEHHRDNAGWTPLHYAAFEGHYEVCDVLLEAGAKVDEKDNDGKGPLMLAAQEGHCRLMELLIDEWGAPVDQHAHDGKTALRVAALEGHFEAVRILVERGADVDALDADQRSTLYILALDNRVSMARYLIQRAGADVETRDSEGRTPLHVSAWQGHEEMVNLLITVGGCMVDARDGERRTPLHSASWRGQAGVVRLLLARGADPSAQCQQGATPLGIASQEGHEQCVLWLLQHGANPKHSDHCGRTPAKVAMRAGHMHVCRLLERWGATPSQPPIDNLQPGSNTSGSTAETKPCTASLSNARLSPVPIMGHNQGSPDSKRRSVHSSNSTKSSSNLTSSTISSSQHEAPAPAPPPHATSINSTSASRGNMSLSFAQQVARCGRRGGRGASDAAGAASPLYATPPHSPLSDVCSPTQPQPLGILSAIAQQFSSNTANTANPANPMNPTDRHFCRDTHMRIILGRDNKHSPPTAGDHKERPAGGGSGGRLSCRRLVGSIGRIARRKKTSSPVVGGKTKRNGIVTNPAMRLVANVRNGLDSAAANLRRTGVALAASASSNNPAVKTNAFQWRRETPL